MRHAILYLIIVCLLSGCGASGFLLNDHVFGNYYLTAVDVEEDLSLTYHESSDGPSYGIIIEGTVFGIGYNDQYIIAEHHPRAWPAAPNKNITDYYILPVKKGFDWHTKNGLIGPLTSEQFSAKRKELNIPDDLTFSKEIKDLK